MGPDVCNFAIQEQELNQAAGRVIHRGIPSVIAVEVEAAEEVEVEVEAEVQWENVLLAGSYPMRIPLPARQFRLRFKVSAIPRGGRILSFIWMVQPGILAGEEFRIPGPLLSIIVFRQDLQDHIP